MAKKRSVNVITMGCSKNLVDSEHLMGRFAAAGWDVSFDKEGTGHEVVIVNTCGFINDAKQESVDMVLEFAEARKNGKIKKFCIIGCLAERYRDELAAEIPEADLVIGVDAIEKLVLEFNLENGMCAPEERVLSTPSHYAYLKISEGCNRRCSFCVIPEIRGKLKSRTVESLVTETELLAGKGVKELILVAQDLTSYGLDIYNENRLVFLLEELSRVKGIEWIRLHYAFPAGFPVELLDLMARNSKICRYLDIPLQHISANMLKVMRRGITPAATRKLVKTIRERVPGIAIRTTMLVGHPGEEIYDFEQLKEFVQTERFDRLGVFAYSHEENTHAHRTMADSIAEEEKERRAAEIMEIQQQISSEINSEKVGKIFRVIIDREDSEFYYGRTEFDSPEVDNEVIIKKTGTFGPGLFCNVLITDYSEFDLFGEVVE